MKKKNALRRSSTYLLLIATLVYGSLFVPHFFQLGNLYNVVVNTAMYGIAALGMMLILVSGAIDLSLGMQVAFASIMACRATAQFGFAAGVVLTVLIGGLIGWMNGAAVSFMNAAPMVTTLGTLSVLQGTGYILAGAGGESGGAIPALRQLFHSVSLGFVPTPMLIFLLTLLAAVVLLKKTALGASIYAMGGSAEACLMAGVPVRRICRVVFFLAGVCAAISGVLFASQMNTGSVVLGENLNLMVLSSCVVGGVSVVGGQGDPLRMISGVAAIQVIQNIMSLYAVAASTQLLITGLILVLILVFDRKLQGRKGAAK